MARATLSKAAPEQELAARVEQHLRYSLGSTRQNATPQQIAAAIALAVRDALNGALTMGTLDGANVEIWHVEAV